METILTAIESLPFSVAIRQSAWLFPTIETLHVMALVLVISAIAMARPAG